MKKLKSNLHVLIAHKKQTEGRRISLRTVADESGVSYRTVLAIANNELREYPTEVMERLCHYFKCTPGDLFILVDTA